MRCLYRDPTGVRRLLEAPACASVGTLKQQIAQHESVEPSDVVLTLGGRAVDAETAVSELCGELDLLEVDVTFTLDGGAKGKKKKKAYSTQKHVAHKRKKVKLAVLKYYAIDGDKIKNLRTSCAGGCCPPGVKMAIHHNRSHCGRCGTTLFKTE